MHQEEGQLSFPASQLLLSYSQPQGEEESPKKRLPNPVTVPRKGPLLLQTSKGSPNKVVGDTEPKSPRRAAHRHYTNPRPQQRPKHSLTRFPVLMLQRPIEEIQSQLGKISCAELSENVKLLSVSPRRGLLCDIHYVQLTGHRSLLVQQMQSYGMNAVYSRCLPSLKIMFIKLTAQQM